MSKAEERSKIYAIHKASEKLHDYYGLAMLSVVQFDGNDIKNAYVEGYHQAEKDLELTWEDIQLIVNIDMDTNNEEALTRVRKNKEHYEEVLRRFLETKK